MKKYILLILLAGCVSSTKIQPGPPLPQSVVPKYTRTTKSYTADKPFDGTVKLSWKNVYRDDTNFVFSCIEGTTNLSKWYEILRVPYATTNFYVLTNRPYHMEFYRVYNAFKY